MFSSTKVGRFAGIDVYIHSTFWLLIIWILFSHWYTGQDAASTISGVVFVLLIFLCVVLHEFGHALTARRFDVGTRDITLYPIGGVARLESIPEDPRQELWIALMGPAVNVGIALILGAYLFLSQSFVPLDTLGVAKGSMVERIMIVNVILVVFNLLPAFPMDGGRVLRALLAMKMNYLSATRAAAQIGQGMALLFGLVGLLYNPILLFIAFFVWIGASGEAGNVQMRQLLRGVTVRDVMVKDFSSVSPDNSLAELRNQFISEPHRAFPVMEDGTFLGVVTEQDLLDGIRTMGEDESVQSVMKSEFTELESDQMLEVALPKLQETKETIAPVFDGEKLIGMITDQGVGKFLMFRASEGESKTGSIPPAK